METGKFISLTNSKSYPQPPTRFILYFDVRIRSYYDLVCTVPIKTQQSLTLLLQPIGTVLASC